MKRTPFHRLREIPNFHQSKYFLSIKRNISFRLKEILAFHQRKYSLSIKRNPLLRLKEKYSLSFKGNTFLQINQSKYSQSRCLGEQFPSEVVLILPWVINIIIMIIMIIIITIPTLSFPLSDKLAPARPPLISSQILLLHHH